MKEIGLGVPLKQLKNNSAVVKETELGVQLGMPLRLVKKESQAATVGHQAAGMEECL